MGDRGGGRVPRLRPDELDPRQQALYRSFVESPRAAEVDSGIVDAEGRLAGPYNYFFVDPAVGEPARELARALSTEAGLPGRLRELVILEAARAVGSEFEWHVHAGIAGRVGLTPEEVAAVLTGTAAPTLDDEEALVGPLVRALVEERALPDDLFARAQAVLGPVRFHHLVMLAAHYVGHALLLTAYAEPLPPGAVPALSPFGDD